MGVLVGRLGLGGSRSPLLSLRTRRSWLFLRARCSLVSRRPRWGFWSVVWGWGARGRRSSRCALAAHGCTVRLPTDIHPQATRRATRAVSPQDGPASTPRRWRDRRLGSSYRAWNWRPINTDGEEASMAAEPTPAGGTPVVLPEPVRHRVVALAAQALSDLRSEEH